MHKTTLHPPANPFLKFLSCVGVIFSLPTLLAPSINQPSRRHVEFFISLPCSCLLPVHSFPPSLALFPSPSLPFSRSLLPSLPHSISLPPSVTVSAGCSRSPFLSVPCAGIWLSINLSPQPGIGQWQGPTLWLSSPCTAVFTVWTLFASSSG